MALCRLLASFPGKQVFWCKLAPVKSFATLAATYLLAAVALYLAAAIRACPRVFAANRGYYVAVVKPLAVAT